MDNSLHIKVHAAAMAGWWTLLVAVLLAVLQAFAGSLLLHSRPPWVQSMWPYLTWEAVENIAVILMTVLRLIIQTLFLVVVWLTIWAAKLKGKGV